MGKISINKASKNGNYFQNVSHSRLSTVCILLESVWNILFLLCIPFKSLSSIAVWYLHRGYWPGKDTKKTDRGSVFRTTAAHCHFQNGYSVSPETHLLWKPFDNVVHCFISSTFSLFLPETMTEFINTVDWYLRDRLQVPSPSPFKDSNKNSFTSFQKFPPQLSHIFCHIYFSFFFSFFLSQKSFLLLLVISQKYSQRSVRLPRVLWFLPYEKSLLSWTPSDT